MNDFNKKVTTRHTKDYNGFRYSITEPSRGDSVFVEAAKIDDYSNSMYFVVSSLEEGFALCTKMMQFLDENGPVLQVANPKAVDENEHV